MFIYTLVCQNKNNNIFFLLCYFGLLFLNNTLCTLHENNRTYQVTEIKIKKLYLFKKSYCVNINSLLNTCMVDILDRKQQSQPPFLCTLGLSRLQLLFLKRNILIKVTLFLWFYLWVQLHMNKKLHIIYTTLNLFIAKMQCYKSKFMLSLFFRCIKQFEIASLPNRVH